MSEPQPQLERVFPKLAVHGYVPTSAPDAGYNCVAWVVGDTTRNWDGTRQGGYWPPGAELGETINHLIRVFLLQGYAICANGDLEPEYEKVALFADADGDWQHAARQLPDGQWSSKLGELEDISHAQFDAVFSDVYGRVACYLRRRLLPREPLPTPQ